MSYLPSRAMNFKTMSLKNSKLNSSNQSKLTFLKRACDLAITRQIYLLDNGYVYKTDYDSFSELTRSVNHPFSIWKVLLQLDKRGYEFRFYTDGCVSFLIELRISMLFGAVIFKEYLMRLSTKRQFKMRNVQNVDVVGELDCQS